MSNCRSFCIFTFDPHLLRCLPLRTMSNCRSLCIFTFDPYLLSFLQFRINMSNSRCLCIHCTFAALLHVFRYLIGNVGT
ncbi:hypothetical protein FKM82_029921 [Ascaphus truei]